MERGGKEKEEQEKEEGEMSDWGDKERQEVERVVINRRGRRGTWRRK